MQVTTVGLDLAKNIFQVHGITADGTLRLKSHSGVHSSCSSSKSLIRVSSVWKPVDRATIGRVSSKNWAMKFG